MSTHQLVVVWLSDNGPFHGEAVALRESVFGLRHIGSMALHDTSAIPLGVSAVHDEASELDVIEHFPCFGNLNFSTYTLVTMTSNDRMSAELGDGAFSSGAVAMASRLGSPPVQSRHMWQ